MIGTCDTGTLVQQAQCALAPVAEKLGKGAAYVWGSYYRQTIIEGATQAVFGVLFLTLAVTATVVGRRAAVRAYHSRKEPGRSYKFSPEESMRTCIAIVGLLISIASYIIGAVMLSNAVPKVINPGYYTVHRIVQQVLGGS